MRSNRLVGAISTLGLLGGIVACGSDGSTGPAGTDGTDGAQGATGATGSEGAAGSAGPQGAAAPTTPAPTVAGNAVYTLSNDATANAIFVYDRAADGSLTPHNAYETGGIGTAAGLGDQGALAFSPSKNLFFAVNAGDSSISMMSLKVDGSLTLVSKIASGGVDPVSITVSNDSVYVVNAGDGGANAANISGFMIDPGGLLPIPSSTQSLSAASPGPAQIQFTPDGKILVVTEKATSMIDTFVVTDGVAASASSQPSAGAVPFGFSFSAKGELVVSEAGPGAASSYSIAANGTLTPVSSSLVSSQAAPCWAVTAGNNVFIANAHSNSLSGYSVAEDGTLALLGTNGVSGSTGAGPVDMAVTTAADFLYTLNSADHSLSAFSVAADGTLVAKPVFVGLPLHAVGLVAR